MLHPTHHMDDQLPMYEPSLNGSKASDDILDNIKGIFQGDKSTQDKLADLSTRSRSDLSGPESREVGRGRLREWELMAPRSLSA